MSLFFIDVLNVFVLNIVVLGVIQAETLVVNLQRKRLEFEGLHHLD